MEQQQPSPRAQRAHQLAVRARELLRADWLRSDPVAKELRKAVGCFKRAAAYAQARPESDAAFRTTHAAHLSTPELMREMQRGCEHLLANAKPPISLDSNADTSVIYNQLTIEDLQ